MWLGGEFQPPLLYEKPLHTYICMPCIWLVLAMFVVVGMLCVSATYFALSRILHLYRSYTDSPCLAIRDTIPYKLTTQSLVEFRVQNILILANDFLAPPELPTFLTTMKEGKSYRYE